MDILPHAVNQFISRFRPDWDYDTALFHLCSQGEHAKKLPERTPAGQERWEIQDPPCILVVKRDAGTGRGRASRFKGDDRVCVTVLYPNGSEAEEFEND
jgi:hypothetical protein